MYALRFAWSAKLVRFFLSSTESLGRCYSLWVAVWLTCPPKIIYFGMRNKKPSGEQSLWGFLLSSVSSLFPLRPLCPFLLYSFAFSLLFFNLFFFISSCSFFLIFVFFVSLFHFFYFVFFFFAIFIFSFFLPFLIFLYFSHFSP